MPSFIETLLSPNRQSLLESILADQGVSSTLEPPPQDFLSRLGQLVSLRSQVQAPMVGRIAQPQEPWIEYIPRDPQKPWIEYIPNDPMYLPPLIHPIQEQDVKPIVRVRNYNPLPPLIHPIEEQKQNILMSTPTEGKVERPFVPLEGFKSKLYETVSKLPSKSTSEQVLGFLKNSGIKGDEMEYSGIEDFLKDKKSVNKSDLQDYIQNKGIKLEKTVNVGIDNTKFDRWQLPGDKENYKETILTLPLKEDEGEKIINKARKRLEVLKDKITTGTMTQAEDDEYSKLQSLITYTKYKSENERKLYQSPHFPSISNPLLHIRSNERKDTEGNNVYFMEELQSDWHQEGREKGYRGQVEKRLSEIEKELSVYNDSYKHEVSKIDPKLNASDWKIELDKLVDKYGELTNDLIRENTRLEMRLPEYLNDAPFKKSWPELGMKQVLIDAAKSGADKLAWTTGEQQADRYDLSKQVDRIYYKKEPDSDEYYINIERDGREIIGKYLKEKDLSNFVGKDIANKMIKGEGDLEIGGTRSIAGENLKIGGEGMKGFYDQILPNIVNKIVKKYGGKVEESKIPTEKKFFNLHVASDDSGHFWVADQKYERVSGIVDTLERAIEIKQALLNPKKESVHSVTITPEMRKAILNEGFDIASTETEEELKSTTGRKG